MVTLIMANEQKSALIVIALFKEWQKCPKCCIYYVIDILIHLVCKYVLKHYYTSFDFWSVITATLGCIV